MPIFTRPIHEHGDPSRPGPYPHEGADRLDTASPEDAERAKALQVGQPVTIDGHSGVVFTVRKVRRSWTRFSDDIASLEQREVPYETVTVRTKNSWGQIAKFTFSTRRR